MGLGIDMSLVPEELKCPLTFTLLSDPVMLPCCVRTVNESAVNQELINNGLKCPLCGASNVSPEQVSIIEITYKSGRNRDVFVPSVNKPTTGA